MNLILKILMWADFMSGCIYFWECFWAGVVLFQYYSLCCLILILFLSPVSVCMFNRSRRGVADLILLTIALCISLISCLKSLKLFSFLFPWIIWNDIPFFQIISMDFDACDQPLTWWPFFLSHWFIVFCP